MRRGARAGRNRVPGKVRFMRTIPKKVKAATRPIYNINGQVIFYGSDEDWRGWVNDRKRLSQRCGSVDTIAGRTNLIYSTSPGVNPRLGQLVAPLAPHSLRQ